MTSARRSAAPVVAAGVLAAASVTLSMSAWVPRAGAAPLRTPASVRLTITQPSKATPGALETFSLSTRSVGGDRVSSYRLSFGDHSRQLAGSGAPPSSVVHGFSDIGVKKVVLTVRNRRGATVTTSKAVTVIKAAGCTGYASPSVDTIGVPITVHVVDRSGRPVVGVPVRNYGDGHVRRYQSFSTDCLGAATFKLAVGPEELDVNTDGNSQNTVPDQPELPSLPALSSPVYDLTIGKVARSLTVTLDPAAEVAGTISGGPLPDGSSQPFGAGLGKATGNCYEPKFNDAGHRVGTLSVDTTCQVMTDASGHYVFGHLPDGATGVTLTFTGEAPTPPTPFQENYYRTTGLPNDGVPNAPTPSAPVARIGSPATFDATVPALGRLIVPFAPRPAPGSTTGQLAYFIYDSHGALVPFASDNGADAVVVPPGVYTVKPFYGDEGTNPPPPPPQTETVVALQDTTYVPPSS